MKIFQNIINKSSEKYIKNEIKKSLIEKDKILSEFLPDNNNITIALGDGIYSICGKCRNIETNEIDKKNEENKTDETNTQNKSCLNVVKDFLENKLNIDDNEVQIKFKNAELVILRFLDNDNYLFSIFDKIFDKKNLDNIQYTNVILSPYKNLFFLRFNNKFYYVKSFFIFDGFLDNNITDVLYYTSRNKIFKNKIGSFYKYNNTLITKNGIGFVLEEITKNIKDALCKNNSILEGE